MEKAESVCDCSPMYNAKAYSALTQSSPLVPFASRRLAGLLAGALLAGSLGHPVFAQVFTIDTNQSTITLSGSVLGYAFMAQGPGSLTTSYQGTVQTALAGGTIQFTGQSVIQAQTNGTWQPKADGSAGSQSADYGAMASAVIAAVAAALRNVQFDVTSPVINVAGGQFDAQGLTFSFPTNASSSLAYNVTGLLSTSGAKPLSGYATNAVASQGTLATSGAQQTLTIPIDATFLLTLVSANDTVVNVKGQLVATRATTAPLAIASIKVQAHTATLQWQSAPGEQFQVLSSTNLTTWQTNATNVTSATGTYTWSGAATAGQQFFRIAQ